MALQLKKIFASLLNKPQFHAITADILFILILVELFRLLIIDLQQQRVSIGVSVEIAIVSVLRVWFFPLVSADQSLLAAAHQLGCDAVVEPSAPGA